MDDNEPLRFEDIVRVVDRTPIVKHYMTREQYDYLTTIGVKLSGDIVIDEDEFEEYGA